MYSFQSHGSSRRDKSRLRLLRVVLFVLIIALAGMIFSYVRISGVERQTSSAISARAVSEAKDAQSAIYRLTQSSGANTASQLAVIRSHIYALQSLNMLVSGIYGSDVRIVDEALLNDCIDKISECETRLQGGFIITDLYTALRDDIDHVAEAFGGL